MSEFAPALSLVTSLVTALLYAYALKLQWPKQRSSAAGLQNSATTQTEQRTRWVVLVALLGHAFSCHQILFSDAIPPDSWWAVTVILYFCNTPVNPCLTAFLIA